MKHKIRKFIVYFLAPLVTMLLAFMKVPDFADKLKSIHADLGKWLDYFVILATAFIYYFTLWSPLKLFERQAKKKWDIMKELANRLNEDYDKKFDFNFNVMLVNLGVGYYIEPIDRKNWYSWFSWKGRQFSFYGKILKVVWDHGNNGISPNFRMTINQGVCGKSFQEGKETSKQNVKGAVLFPELLDGHDFKLNDEQKRMTDGIILIASCPLVIKDKDVDRQKKKVIGVLNVESRCLDSPELLVETPTRDKFYEKIANLANIYLNLHS
jgi:hypothetical protein